MIATGRSRCSATTSATPSTTS